MSADDARRRQIRLLALAVCTLSVLIVAVSAYLRLDAAGLGCTDWPACYGGILAGEPPPLRYGSARVLHRIAASTALVLALVLVWRCRRPTPVVALRPAALLLLLMLALAALGFLSADPRRALVGFLNIVGGLGLVSFSWRVALAASGGAGTTGRRPALLLAGVICTTLAVLSGAWLGATYSAAACTSLPFCASTPIAGTDIARALAPLQQVDAARGAGDAAGILLHTLHRAFALGAVILLAAAALRAGGSSAKRVATATAMLAAAAALLGAIAVGAGLPLAPTVAHGTLAAILLAAIASWMRR